MIPKGGSLWYVKGLVGFKGRPAPVSDQIKLGGALAFTLKRNKSYLEVKKKHILFLVKRRKNATFFQPIYRLPNVKSSLRHTFAKKNTKNNIHALGVTLA